MSPNESIVEDSTLEWFLLRQGYGGQVGDQPSPSLRLTRLGYAVGHGPHLAPGEHAGGTLTPALSPGERESYSEVVQFHFACTLIPAFSQREKELREAIRWLTPAIPEEARATIRPNRIVRFERRLNP